MNPNLEKILRQNFPGFKTADEFFAAKGDYWDGIFESANGTMTSDFSDEEHSDIRAANPISDVLLEEFDTKDVDFILGTYESNNYWDGDSSLLGVLKEDGRWFECSHWWDSTLAAVLQPQLILQKRCCFMVLKLMSFIVSPLFGTKH